MIEIVGLSKIYSSKGPNQSINSVKALHNLTYTINKGDSIGLIGKNGSGKSTLLGMLSGIIKPSEGSIKLHGKIASILDVGSGFHPDLTGRENVFFFGKLLGLSSASIQSLFRQIWDFSEIGDYINLPVKKYSNGMYLRLAISVALHSDCDIMLIDEVISVGDAQFKLKVANRLNTLKQNGVTLVVASHSTNEILQMCNKCLVFDNGNIVASGNTIDCLQQYLNAINVTGIEQKKSENVKAKPAWKWEDKRDAPGNEMIKIHSVNLSPLSTLIDFDCLYIEDTIVVEVEFWKETALSDIQLLFLIYDVLGNPIFYSTSLYSNGTQKSFIDLYKNEIGLFNMTRRIPSHFFNHGIYRMQLRFGHGAMEELYIHEKFFQFEICENPSLSYYKLRDLPVSLRPQFEWTYQKLR